MSNLTCIRCPNPKCNKLNPIQLDDAESGKEYTCIFCGFIIAPEKTVGAKGGPASKSKSRSSRFPPQRSESKPVNRNMRKPTF